MTNREIMKLRIKNKRKKEVEQKNEEKKRFMG